MKKEDINAFVGDSVKLAFQNGFVLKGNIEKVTDDTVYFQTEESKSIIDIRNIASIIQLRH